MHNLFGLIVPLRKFFSNTQEDINLPVIKDSNSNSNILNLKENRIYKIPDFQREIRWTSDNISQLIDDLSSAPRYLGNIILTKHSDNSYSIIDGQQRITVLTLILLGIKMHHSQNIDTIEPCKLEIESFSAFYEVANSYFSDELMHDATILETDLLHQLSKYSILWDFIANHNSISNKLSAKTLLDNIANSEFNIIMNYSDDINDSIRYFIDVNLKGKQLDAEDIFKSYLFKNDSSAKIRTLWTQFKTNALKVEKKINYPLLKLLEHYFYCDLFQTNEYKGLEFDDNFCLKKEFFSVSATHTFRKGAHIIDVISNNQYMITTLENLNKITEIMLQFVSSSAITDDCKKLFEIDSKKHIDTEELQIIHNLIGKILKDKNLLPKALIMKYFLEVFLSTEAKAINDYKKIYGVYMLSVLFTIFENKKSKDLLLTILKSPRNTWYDETVSQVQSYFSSDKITDARLLAQYKLATNEDLEDYRFRCKSLACIYNFFEIKNNFITLSKGCIPLFNQFLSNNYTFSLEHLIFSDSKNKTILFTLKSGDVYKYIYNDSLYKKYVNNLFNFIFIPQSKNSDLSNKCLPEKIKHLESENIHCSYSKMVIENVNLISEKITEILDKSSDELILKNNLDLYFMRDFKDDYIAFARNVLDKVIQKISHSI